MKLSRILLSYILAMLSAALHAQSATDSLFCREGGFPGQNGTFGMARLADGGPVYFLDDLNGCPSQNKTCRRRRVRTNAALITGRSHGGFICAFQRERNSDDAEVGWVWRDRLRMLPVDRNPKLGAWMGYWVASNGSDNVITITRQGQSLAACGNAYWPGADPPLDQFPGGPNLGIMGGHAVPEGNRIMIGEPSECLVVIHLVGSVLIVHDNGVCGGMNVRFDGLYTNATMPEHRCWQLFATNSMSMQIYDRDVAGSLLGRRYLFFPGPFYCESEMV